MSRKNNSTALYRIYTVLYRTVPYGTALYRILPRCVVPHRAVSYCAVTYRTALYRIVLCRAVLRCTVSYCSVPYRPVAYRTLLCVRALVEYVFNSKTHAGRELCSPKKMKRLSKVRVEIGARHGFITLGDTSALTNKTARTMQLVM